MATSIFDPNQFAAMTFNEANDTEFRPCPAGEYPAKVDKVEVTSWQARDGSSSGLKLNVFWDIDDQAAREETGREKVIVRQEMMLDLTEEGMLATGKGRNVLLGRLREATGLNVSGEPFAFPMLSGRPAKVNVTHRLYEGQLYAEVKGVAKL